MSLAGPCSIMKGTLSEWLAISLALSEGLMLVRKMRGVTLFPSASCQALQLSRHTAISVRQALSVQTASDHAETWILQRVGTTSLLPLCLLL